MNFVKEIKIDRAYFYRQILEKITVVSEDTLSLLDELRFESNEISFKLKNTLHTTIVTLKIRNPITMPSIDLIVIDTSTRQLNEEGFEKLVNIIENTF
ncbi:MAG: hypothetical protein ACRCTZ_04600 [Sarcina sp.]